MRIALSSLTWMKAVAIMTPEPKYLVKKKAQSGTFNPGCCLAITGKRAPISKKFQSVMGVPVRLILVLDMCLHTES